MKLFILQEKLKEGLTIAERFISKSTALPILNNVLMRAKKNFLNLTLTDLELGVNWWTLAKIEKEGEAVVPAALLSSFFSLLPNKQVTIQKKEPFLMVECENYNTQIKGFSVQDFPIIPQVPQENFIEIDAGPFCQGLEQVVDIATPSQARPEISGIYFALEKDTIRMAATDSFRLGEKIFFLNKTSTLKGTPIKEISFIFPQKTAREVINIFKDKEGKLKIYFTANQVLFENQLTGTSHPQVHLFSRLLEGEYPAYQEIIPKKYDTQAVLNKNNFLNQLKVAALFSGKINEIKIKIDQKMAGIEINSQNPDLGEHRSFLAGEVKGEPVEISFNQRFLINGLLSIKSSEVIFGLNKQEGPAALKPVGDTSYQYVVMPIKSS